MKETAEFLKTDLTNLGDSALYSRVSQYELAQCIALVAQKDADGLIQLLKKRYVYNERQYVFLINVLTLYCRNTNKIISDRK